MVRLQDGDSVCLEIEEPTRGNRGNYRNQCARNSFGNKMRAHGHDDYRRGDERDLRLYPAQIADRKNDAADRAVTGRAQPQQSRDFVECDLDAHPGQKANQNRAREEIGEKAEANQPCDEEKDADHRSHGPRERHPFRRIRRGHAR